MVRVAVVSVAVLVALAVAPSQGFAIAPTIESVSAQDRHPSAVFSARRAESVTVYIASQSDRATDGSFLQENVVATDFLTSAEVESGFWTDSSQVNPGVYYVMLRASRSYERCVTYNETTSQRFEDPLCADGYSNIVPLNIPEPETSYRVKADVLQFIREVSLVITADPIGTRVPYAVCWRQPTGARRTLKKRCMNGAIPGYSWNDPASDSLSVSTKGMTRRTKFTWYTRGDDPGNVLRSKTFTVY